VNREVVRREAAEHVGDLQHDRASEAGHQPIEQSVERYSGRCGEVRIDRGGRDVRVAEQDLHDPDVDAVLDQPCRVRMPQGMRGYAVANARRVSRGGEGVRQHVSVERPISAPIGEQPAWVAMGPPHRAELVENRLGQQHQPLLVALANDTQHLVGAVDGADLQMGGFADAQAARIHGGEARPGDHVADVAEQLTDLLLGQRMRQPLLSRDDDPFFPGTGPSHGGVCAGRGSGGHTGQS